MRNVLWHLGITFLLCYLVAGPGITGCSKSKPLSDGTRIDEPETLELDGSDEDFEDEAPVTTTLPTITPSLGTCETLTAAQTDAAFAASVNTWYVRLLMQFNGVTEGVVILADGSTLYQSSANRFRRVKGAFTTQDVTSLGQLVEAALGVAPQIRTVNTTCEAVVAKYETQRGGVASPIAKRTSNSCKVEYVGGNAGLALSQLTDKLLLRARSCP